MNKHTRKSSKNKMWQKWMTESKPCQAISLRTQTKLPRRRIWNKKKKRIDYLNLVKWYFDNQIVAVIKNALLVQHITDTTWYKFPSSQCSYHIWHKIHELTHPFMILYKIGSWHFKVFLVNNGKFMVCWSILGPMCHRVIYSFVFCCKVIKPGCKCFKW